MNIWIKHIIRFVLTMAVQVLVLKDISIQKMGSINGFSWFSPFLYLLFLLMLPVGLKRWQMVLIGFATGMIMDMFSNTSGAHTAACVLMCYLRPGILRLFLQSNVVKDPIKTSPTLTKMGFSSFVLYCSSCLLVFNLYYYILWYWGFSHFFATLGMIILSLLSTLILFIVSQLLFLDTKTKK